MLFEYKRMPGIFRVVVIKTVVKMELKIVFLRNKPFLLYPRL